MFLTILLFLSNPQIYSQPPAPPPPVAKGVNKTAAFDSAEGGFKIDFPVKPIRSVRTVNGAYGETPTINFQAVSDDAVFVVVYTDLPALLKEKLELETQLNGVKQRFLNFKNSRLIKEVEIKIEDNFSKEFIFETDKMTVFTRGLIVHQRFFQITFMSPVAISKLPNQEKNSIQARANKFLDSFAITKLPEFVDKSKNLPEDFGIKVDGTIFTSKYLKLEMELPENWYFIEDWDSNSVTELLQEDIDSSTPKAKEELDYSIKNTKVLLMMSKEKFESGKITALLSLAVEKMPFPNTLPEVMVKYFQENSLETNEKVTKPISTSVFGGKKFAWIEYFNAEDKTTERLYAVNIDGLMFEVVMVYQTEADLKKMLATLATIRFLK